MATQNDDEPVSRRALLDRRTLLALAGSATIAGVVGSGTAGGSASLPKPLAIDATGRSEPCEYAIEVSEALSVVPTASNAVASRGTASVRGTVTDGTVGIHYAGDLAGVSIDGSADVHLGADAAAAMPEPSHEIVITAPGEVAYEFTTTGPAARILDGSDVAAEEGNDAITDDGDGTYTVSGYTGNGYGDAYVYEGSVESFSPREGEFTVRVDGEETTPADLAGGDSGSGPGDGRDLAHELVVRSGDGAIHGYSITVAGTARPGSSTDTHDHQYRDRVVENGDGTVTIEGWVRDRIDDYPFEGTITGVDAPAPVEFALDGSDVSRAELIDGSDDDPGGGSGDGSDGGGSDDGESHHLAVRSEDGSTREYTVTVEGTASPGSSANTRDHQYRDRVVENGDGTVTIEGWVASASDDYTFEGTVTGVEAGAPVAFALDGADVSRAELVDGSDDEPGGGSDDGSASAPAIGGGEAYGSTVSPDAATVTVSTRSALSRALSRATAGDVVYVAGDADLDLGQSTVTVPAGVTLASDRGIDGAPGGRLYTTRLHDDHYGLVRAERDARITGLRVEGPIDPEGWTPHSSDYEITGIYAHDVGVEVDNVEVQGWGYACVYTHDDTHVHHSTIHHANVEGLGYGVMTGSAENPIVEYNRFFHNRHSVASSGGGGYTVRYNHVAGPAISHVFDQHDPGGTTTKIYNNTVAVADNATEDERVPAVAIRGVPDDTADVSNNWFYNPEAPRDAPRGWTHEAIVQVRTDSWRNVAFWGNHYGADEPADDVGCPR